MRVRQFVLSLSALVLFASITHAQTTNVRVRGTITGLDGNVLSVKSRDGRDLKIQLADNVAVAVAKAIKFEDIKQGDYLGVTTLQTQGGALRAIEVHYLAPTVPEGHIPWDLEPGSMMTNANVEAIAQSTGARQLLLRYKDGRQAIAVPDDVPLVRAVPGTRTDLAVGEYVFIGAQSAPDGTLSAARVQVSKDGVKPPQ